MKVDDGIIHERKVVVRFDEADIIAVLVERAAMQAGGIHLGLARKDCVISKRDRPGTSGFESFAVVTLTVDLGAGDGK